MEYLSRGIIPLDLSKMRAFTSKHTARLCSTSQPSVASQLEDGIHVDMGIASPGMRIEIDREADGRWIARRTGLTPDDL